MPNVDLAPTADRFPSRAVVRRTLLVSAAGAVAAAGLSGPARAAGPTTSVAARSGPLLVPVLGGPLPRALRDALREPSITARGAILLVRATKVGAWTGVAGLGRVAP